ncbi:hypothetical protein MBLNU230_g7965t1 [Neophaeotheca triangularis]
MKRSDLGLFLSLLPSWSLLSTTPTHNFREQTRRPSQRRVDASRLPCAEASESGATFTPNTSHFTNTIFTRQFSKVVIMDAMDSPGRSPDPESQEDANKVSFRFCQECSNMLYPKEDKLNTKLMYSCRSCQYSEEAGPKASDNCIYRNELAQQVFETAGNVEDVADDPTVSEDPANMSQQMDEGGAGYETVPDMCTLCGQEITCPICGGASDNGMALEVDDPAGAVGMSGQQSALPHSADYECKRCGQRDHVYFQSVQRTAETGMALFYVCTKCTNVWSTIEGQK